MDFYPRDSARTLANATRSSTALGHVTMLTATTSFAMRMFAITTLVILSCETLICRCERRELVQDTRERLYELNGDDSPYTSRQSGSSGWLPKATLRASATRRTASNISAKKA